MAKLPGDEQILQRLDNSFTQLEDQRLDHLIRIKLLQTSKDNALKKEQLRLSEKYGADHPRVSKINNRIYYNKLAIQEIEDEIKRADVKIPEFDSNTWMIHGRILDSDRNALEGLTVSLSGESNNWIRELGHTCTDKLGYYALRYIIEDGQTSVFSENDNLYLTVTDSNHKLLLREIKPLQVSIGYMDYRLLIITGDVCVLPEPGNVLGVIPPDAWIAQGVVVYEDETPAAGLTISLYDKDLVFDDVLGTTLTDSSGKFKIIYRTEAFRDLFEQKPDLYIEVLDSKGNRLYVTEKPFRSEVGRVENFLIKLKKKTISEN